MNAWLNRVRDIFISYRNEDKAWADRLCEGLESQNVTCWMAPRDIAGGQEWAAAIVDALQKCKAFVLVLSSNSVNAKQISREAELADRQGLPIITFRVEDVQPPPGLLYFLGDLQWLDAFGNRFDSAVGQVASVVKSGAAPKSMPAVVPAPASRIPPRTLAIVAGALILVGVVVALMIYRGAPRAADAAGARAEAERFLNALKASDFDQAWDQFTPEARAANPKPRMMKIWNTSNEKNGSLQSFGFDRCMQNSSPDVMTCLFKLQYGGGPAQGRYVLTRSANGSWGISESRHSEPKKGE